MKYIFSILGIGLLSLISAFNKQHIALLLFSTFFFVSFLFSFVFLFLNVRYLSISRNSFKYLKINTDSQYGTYCHIANHTFIPKFGLILSEVWKNEYSNEVIDVPVAQIEYIEPLGNIEIQGKALACPRGAWTIQGLRIKTMFPYGLVLKNFVLDGYTDRIDVMPKKIQPNPQVLAKLDQLASEATHGLNQGLKNFKDYKEYAPGDSFKDIDWKKYAKIQKVVVKTYTQAQHLNMYFIPVLTSENDATNEEVLAHMFYFLQNKHLSFVSVHAPNHEQFMCVSGMDLAQAERFMLSYSQKQVRNLEYLIQCLARKNIAGNFIFIASARPLSATEIGLVQSLQMRGAHVHIEEVPYAKNN